MTPDRIVEFAESLGRVAAAGGGAKALAALLAETTEAGVLVEDAEWRTIATAGKGSLPATARGLTADHSLTVPIVAGSVSFGWLTIVGPHVNADGAIPALRLTANSIAVELARDTTGARGRKRGFWERFIDGGYHDVTTAREDAAMRGIALVSHYVCVLLESEAGSDMRALCGDAFRSGEAEVGITERGQLLVAIVPAAREIDANNARTAALLVPKAAAKRGITGAISGGVSSAVPVAEITRALAEAEAALAISRRIYGTGRVCAYDDLGAYPLLYRGASVEELRAFAERTLAPLRFYDEKHQTELERTLRCYFRCGQNVKTASEELAVHRHTVFYRLRQIGEISGRALESPHDQLTLRLAIAIDALHT